MFRNPTSLTLPQWSIFTRENFGQYSYCCGVKTQYHFFIRIRARRSLCAGAFCPSKCSVKMLHKLTLLSFSSLASFRLSGVRTIDSQIACTMFLWSHGSGSEFLYALNIFYLTYCTFSSAFFYQSFISSYFFYPSSGVCNWRILSHTVLWYRTD